MTESELFAEILLPDGDKIAHGRAAPGRFPGQCVFCGVYRGDGKPTTVHEGACAYAQSRAVAADGTAWIGSPAWVRHVMEVAERIARENLSMDIAVNCTHCGTPRNPTDMQVITDGDSAAHYCKHSKPCMAAAVSALAKLLSGLEPTRPVRAREFPTSPNDSAPPRVITGEQVDDALAVLGLDARRIGSEGLSINVSEVRAEWYDNALRRTRTLFIPVQR